MAEKTPFWKESDAKYYFRATFSDPAGARTQDPLIKSQVLYQLSYGIK